MSCNGMAMTDTHIGHTLLGGLTCLYDHFSGGKATQDGQLAGALQQSSCHAAQADLNSDVVPVGQSLLHVVRNVNGDLDEEGNSQPADHGIPPEEGRAVGQQHPDRQVVRYDVACTQHVLLFADSSHRDPPAIVLQVSQHVYGPICSRLGETAS